ncbi:hypothetical protein MOV08_40000 [Streptomyces yunnanensis]|uniref:Uncharacterized protein n=1 Tax=Streptomyces yunnanensis TaxID=156453 RepID=A0ABY8AIR3_9ACTN|nr:hypothetical protein [Streptomyces yunnanensis]WEB44863.1 hypothetical protein MOV08_40000 [Streptomyces yunnanensis]
MGAVRDDGTQRARDLAREAVRRLAPEELALFEGTAEAYFDDPRRGDRKVRQEPLGIGIDAVVIGTLTQFALPVASAVAGNIATDVLRRERRRGWWRLGRRGGGGDGGDGDGSDGGGGGSANPFAAPGAVPAVEQNGGTQSRAEETVRLRRIAYDRAIALGLPPAQAELLADAIVGGMQAPPASGEEGTTA